MLTEDFRLPDAGQLQEFRRIDGPATDDDFATDPCFSGFAADLLSDADAACAVHND